VTTGRTGDFNNHIRVHVLYTKLIHTAAVAAGLQLRVIDRVQL